MSETHVVVLAAGKGTRMKSAVPKVLHRVAGLPMIEHVLRTAAAVHPTSVAVVVGHQADLLRRALPAAQIVLQEPQLGTAHALLQVETLLGNKAGTLVLLSGDVPLLRAETLMLLLEKHAASAAAATVLTAEVARPFGYGRIVRSRGRISRIVEERDASTAQKAIREINTGIYAFDLAPLFGALKEIAATNSQGEYYLTDLVAVYRRGQLPVETVMMANVAETKGINSRSELAEVGALVRQAKNEELMAAGVTIEDPATAYIDADVAIGADTVIHPCVVLEGRTTIGAACEIHAGARIIDSDLGDRVVVLNHCVISGARIASGASVGPFAHIRPESEIGEDARVGNFVELKKTRLGARSKANHLTYLGDATVGEQVNVGAGTITCNYDGEQKHPTVIDDGAFIGSDSQLIAPVRVGRGAYVAAGSSVTEDVPPGALAVARSRQINKEGWAATKKVESQGKP